jgi:hypothetical protein
MCLIRRASVLLLFAMAFVAFQFWGTEAQARSSYYTSYCGSCHDAATSNTCNGCHHHGPVGLKGVTNKTSYAPGETVSVTVSGGGQNGWFRAILYDQNNRQVAISNGDDSGMGNSATYPTTLSAPAPTTPGTYTWKAAWFGNSFDTNNMNANSHAEVAVNTNSFTVTAPADTTAPVVGTFTLPATATSLTVSVTALSATDNIGVTGYLVTTSSTKPAASAAGWSAAAPSSVTAPAAGSVTFYAWAKDAAGNVSAAKSATVTISINTVTPPTLTVSTLADGTYTNQDTVNVSGNASDSDGIESVTVNGQAVTVNPDGSFSTALILLNGPNVIRVVATDTVGTQQTNSRTVTYDPNAPVITVSNLPTTAITPVDRYRQRNGQQSSTVFARSTPIAQAATMAGNDFSITAYLVAGGNTIDIDATDPAGNTSSAKRTITYEVAQVSVAVTSPEQDITTSNSSLTLKGTVADGVGTPTISITIDGITYSPAIKNGRFQQRLTFDTAKQYAIAVTVTDEAGNSSTVYRNVIYSPVAKGGHGGNGGGGNK